MAWHKIILLLAAVVNAIVSQEDPGNPLYLTSLIKEGRIDEAQLASLVTEFLPVKSYSGFITVNETASSHLFFWYFPAEPSYNETDDDIPVLLWSNGGPGVPCMDTIFGNSGPFLPTGDLNYSLNSISWYKKYHVIYLDNPVTVGFSHTETGQVYSASSAAKDIYAFLQQFFQLFPHLQNNPFYNTGVSYGGRFSTETAHYIHLKNVEENDINLHINLTGLIEDCPLFEFKTQVNFANVLYGAGLISKNDMNFFILKEEEIKRLVLEEKWMDAFNQLVHSYFAEIGSATGFEAIYNIIGDGPPGIFFDLDKFTKLNSTRRALHVGSIPFGGFIDPISLGFEEDFTQSSASKLGELLSNGYRFLMLIGNMDVVTGHLGLRKTFEETIKWEGSDALWNGNRTIWKVNEKVGGYLTEWGNAKMIIVRNAAHGCYVYQPGLMMDAISDFLG